MSDPRDVRLPDDLAPAHVHLTPIEPDDYVRIVLPQTYELWGDGRTYQRYVDDFFAVSRLRYARRRKFTVGFFDDKTLGATCKLYARDAQWGSEALRAVGIGAVFTPKPFRGRGYASVMLGALLDAERAAGTDIAYLFSDIRPEFYERLGFRRLPSRAMTVRAAALDPGRIAADPLQPADWAAMQRCFDALAARRAWVFKRTPGVWEWMRLRWEPRAESGVQHVNLVARAGRTIRAYVIGKRVMRRDTFVVDEFGYHDDEARPLVAPLLRMAAGDLARVGGWLPPEPARSAMPHGSVRTRASAILMAVPLSARGRAWWAACGAARESAGDPVWTADHV